MSTTRHLVNRQRRLAATAAVRTREPVPAVQPGGHRGPGERIPEAASTPTRSSAAAKPPRRLLGPAALALVTVLFGGFAGWAAHHASVLRDDLANANTALTDTAGTSEVKGTVGQEINAIFSYNYAYPAKTDDAAETALTGRAVAQYSDLLAAVRKQATTLKLVLTTTVTDSGVELLDRNRARLLVFADQRNASTTKPAESSYSAAMFAVDAVRQDGGWKISNLDTFSR
jgi:Mce-associated membrane protein